VLLCREACRNMTMNLTKKCCLTWVRVRFRNRKQLSFFFFLNKNQNRTLIPLPLRGVKNISLPTFFRISCYCCYSCSSSNGNTGHDTTVPAETSWAEPECPNSVVESSKQRGIEMIAVVVLEFCSMRPFTDKFSREGYRCT